MFFPMFLKTYSYAVALLVLIAGSLDVPTFAQARTPSAVAEPIVGSATESIEGEWFGALSVEAQNLRLLFVLESDEKGSVGGKLVSLDQGKAILPVESGSFVNGKLELSFPNAHASFSGIISPDGKIIAGSWTQGTAKLPLELGRTPQLSRIGEPFRPQTPKGPFPYRVLELEIENASEEGRASGVVLSGSLVLPEGKGPFPAMLFLSGSGPQDRDETIAAHKPFAIIADRLARSGIASLRCDDRGVGASRGDASRATTVDFAGDARAELAALISRPEIDPTRVGLLGHSEGALVAFMIAASNKDVSCIVSLGGPGLPGSEILYAQSKLIGEAEGASSVNLAKGLVLQKRLIAIAAGPEDETAAKEAMGKAASELLGQAAAQAASPSFIGLLSPWMRAFLRYDPRPDIARVRVPILAIGGGLDLQVPATENLAAILAAARSAGGKAETILLPGLNHLFQTARTGSPSEYERIEESLAASLLALLDEHLPILLK